LIRLLYYNVQFPVRQCNDISDVWGFVTVLFDLEYVIGIILQFKDSGVIIFVKISI